MLAIRLRRTGSKKRPFFRVVVTDSRAARDSSFVEVLGHYNPRTKPETLKLESRAARALAEVGRAAVGHGAHAGGPHAGGAGGCRRGDGGAAPRREPRTRRRRGRRAARWPTSRTPCGSPSATQRGQTLVELSMAPGDLGRVIGRQGRTRRRCARWSNCDGGARRHEGDAGIPGRRRVHARPDAHGPISSWSGASRARTAIAGRSS